MRPYIRELDRVRSLARAVGPNPHRWGIDEHVRKGVVAADLFVAAMVVVALALSGLRPPFWFFFLFPVPVFLFAAALLLVVSAQSRDEERIHSSNKPKK